VERGRLKARDEVIVPAATFATVVSPLYQLGLVPVYVDVDEGSWGLDPDEVERAIGPRTKAIMPVHTLGYPVSMDRLMEVAKAHDLMVLEDCCEAHGARWKEHVVGSMGDASTLSFFVAHNITTGEGGMIFTSDDDLAETCRSLREFGRMRHSSLRFVDDGALTDYDVRYVFERSGYNVRMTDVTAGLGVVQISRLEELNAQRRERVDRLRAILAPFAPALEVPAGHPDTVSANYGFPIRVGADAGFTRRDLCEHLEASGIETRAMMGGSLPDQPAFRDLHHRIAGELPRSRVLRDRAFFIGCHPAVTDAQLDGVAEVLGNFVRDHGAKPSG
jgi:CDP-6-deoxy-D-xylo-4-hexulose-3-dehydrase